MTLGVPVVSHDRKAINTLGRDGIQFTEPLLRMYDLLGFGVQTKSLVHADCDKVRDTLLNHNEFVMQCFERCKFFDGLPFFFPRLADAAFPLIGAPTPVQSLDKRLFISRTT
jgi:hypothetical protein